MSVDQEVPPPGDLPANPEATYDPAVLGLGIADRSDESTAARLGSLPQSALHPGDSTSWPRNFVFRRKIAEGGFGEVWEASQEALGRVVAVKRIRPDLQDSTKSSLSRRALLAGFRQEALTAAQLDHPNIVPVYDFGLDEEGSPLLAMKRVHGRTWKEVLTQDFAALPAHDFLARHLQILLGVAQAVAFAHSHGIVHRDLKPHQVMVGDYGEVLLMDWGLAMAYESQLGSSSPILRAADLSSTLYNPSNPAGTPCYMAPEQTEPTAENLGPWTDIYLLGGILYELLTGQVPRRGPTSAVTFRLAQQGRVRPMQEAAPDREIPPQLEQLAMKCLARAPRDRVASAETFVRALQDYLTGADRRRDSLQLLRAAEAAAAARADYAALGDALNKLDQALMLWPGNAAARTLRQSVLARYATEGMAGGDLKLARLSAERLPDGPERVRLLHEINTREEQQRRQEERLQAANARARQDRDRAESLVRFLLGDLHQALRAIGRLDVLQSVIAESLAYFDSLDESEAAGESLHNRAVALLRIGDVLSDQGKKGDAEAAYLRALEVAERLALRDASRPDWAATVADIRDALGQIAYYQGQMERALASHLTALAIRSRLVHHDPTSPVQRAALAGTRHLVSIIHWRTQDFSRALDGHRDAVETLRALLAEKPDCRDLRARLAWSLSTLGNVYRDLGRLEDAVQVTREAMALREALSAEQPHNTACLDDITWVSGNLALLHMVSGELEEALAVLERDLPVRLRLAGEDPSSVVRLGTVTFALGLQAEVLFALGRVEESEKVLSDCLERTRRLVERDHLSAPHQAAFAHQSALMAEIHGTLGRWPKAARGAREALDVGRRVLALSPRNAFFQKTVVRLLLILGRAEQLLATDGGSARRLWEEAWALAATIQGAEDVWLASLRAQLAVLLGSEPEATRQRVEALRRRRWVTPALHAVLSARVPDTSRP